MTKKAILVIFLLFSTKWSIATPSHTSYVSSAETTRRDALANFIAAHQVYGGGFVCSLIEDVPSIYGAYLALNSLKILDRVSIIDTDSLLDFIMSLYDSGKFRCQPNIDEVYIYETYEAIESLKILSRLDMIDKDAVIDWLLSMYVPEVGLFYAHYEPDGSKEDLYLPFGTATAVFALDLLGALDRINKTKTINALYKYTYDKESGLFLEIGINPLKENYYFIKALKILGGINETIAYRNAFTVI